MTRTQDVDVAFSPVVGNRSTVAGTARKALVYVALTAGLVLSLFPLAWLIRSALMTTDQIFVVPPEWFPRPFAWSNFSGALQASPFAHYFLNTLQIAVIVVPCTLVSCSLAAFAFTRVQWRGRDVCFAALMTGMLLPAAATLVPTFIGWQAVGMVNTYIPLTLPSLFAAGGAFNIFLLRQFFLTIPRDFDAAVYIDGGSPFTVYRKIILPLSKGPLILVGSFTFISVWNDLLNPVIYLNDPSKFTVSLGLATFVGQYSSQWGFLMAASLLAIIPLILVFFIAQRWLVGGLTVGGVKG